MGLGDDLLHFNGIGERITAGMYNNDKPSPADRTSTTASPPGPPSVALR